MGSPFLRPTLCLLLPIAVSGCTQKSSFLADDGANAYYESASAGSCGPAVMAGQGSSFTPFLLDPTTGTNPLIPKITGPIRVLPDDKRARLILPKGVEVNSYGDGGNYGPGMFEEVNYWSGPAFPYYMSGFNSTTPKPPSPLRGFYIELRDSQKQLVKTVTTTYYDVDLQPLTPGETYEATIWGVNNEGQVGQPSDPVIIRASTQRSDELKALCTGFFDDFNLSAGALDELKWNQVIRINNGLTFDGTFINNQYHAHSTVATNGLDKGFYNDRSFSSTRPRGTFNFAGRTGKILFDMDGAEGGRNTWYLDIHPASRHFGSFDQHGHARVETSMAGEYPYNFLRLQVDGQRIEIQRVDPTGARSILQEWNYNAGYWSATPIHMRSRLVPNSQKHWEVALSKSRVDIYVDGRWATGVDINPALDFEEAQFNWVTAAYNSGKDSSSYVNMIHWDNFCFDGPAKNVRTHNYKLAMSSGSENVSTTPVQLEIPDSFSNALRARFLFTLSPVGYQGYQGWNSQQNILINGNRIAMPDPKTINTNAVDYNFISGNSPFAMAFEVPATYFQTGMNTLKFDVGAAVSGVHVEFDFDPSSAPAYTQPYDIHGKNLANPRLAANPKMFNPGPRTWLVGWSKAGYQDWMWTWGGGPTGAGGINFELPANGAPYMIDAGATQMGIRVDFRDVVKTTGGNAGLDKVEIVVDGQVVVTHNAQTQVPAPAIYIRLDFDTTPFADGAVHQLQVIATDSTGRKGFWMWGPSFPGVSTIAPELASSDPNAPRAGYYPAVPFQVRPLP
jgi:hypothetical protein